MEIKSLAHTHQSVIYQCFKLIFTNYILPLELDEEMTMKRWKLAGVDYTLSYGMFDKGECVGIILHLKNERTLHNFATGIIPAYRGRHLISEIYQHIEKEIFDFDYYSLEVIKHNDKALRLYQNLNFKISRELISFEGTLSIPQILDRNHTYIVEPVKDSKRLSLFQFSKPAMENSSVTINLHPMEYELHELKDPQGTMAYAIYHPSSASLQEVGGQGPIEENLDRLFLKMKLNGEKIRIMNVDEKAGAYISYLRRRGLEVLVTQYEMLKKIR